MNLNNINKKVLFWNLRILHNRDRDREGESGLSVSCARIFARVMFFDVARTMDITTRNNGGWPQGKKKKKRKLRGKKTKKSWTMKRMNTRVLKREEKASRNKMIREINRRERWIGGWSDTDIDSTIYSALQPRVRSRLFRFFRAQPAYRWQGNF